MNMKSSFLFLTIFEIGITAVSTGKRSSDLNYLKTNAHQLHVSSPFCIVGILNHIQNFQTAMDHCLAHNPQEICLASMLESDDMMADAW